jgi:hypothetical protein
MTATSQSGGITAARTLHLNEIAQEMCPSSNPSRTMRRDG